MSEPAGYDGAVTTGGPSQTRLAGGLEVRKLCVGPMDNNCYLLTDRASGERLLIDAANDAPRLLAELDGAPLATIVTTHQHGDHWQALAELSSATGARTVAHPLDAGGLPVAPDLLVSDGDELSVGGQQLGVIHLQGHTAGSIALLYRGDPDQLHLFTGDCLFPGGPGNTDSDPQRFTALMADLEHKVFSALPDQTWVYPGHGGDTTLGAERPHLQEWRERGF